MRRPKDMIIEVFASPEPSMWAQHSARGERLPAPVPGPVREKGPRRLPANTTPIGAALTAVRSAHARKVGYFFFLSSSAACAAAKRATGTRNGEQLT